MTVQSSWLPLVPHVFVSSFDVTGKVNVFVTGTVVLSSGFKMLNGSVVDCDVVSVDVFVRGIVMLTSGLKASVVDCVVSVCVFVRGTVVLSSELNAEVVDYLVVSVDVFVRGTVLLQRSSWFAMASEKSIWQLKF